MAVARSTAKHVRDQRRNLSVRVVRLHDEGHDADLLGLSPEQRIAMMWPLALDAWLVADTEAE